mmetsp:Transcript_4537/g.11341  ORF Transcript_4537/g.11341 Transcript_4537/m.11341 type:complete len:232 (-) Transcript_4537:48-743(-)
MGLRSFLAAVRRLRWRLLRRRFMASGPRHGVPPLEAGLGLLGLLVLVGRPLAGATCGTAALALLRVRAVRGASGLELKRHGAPAGCDRREILRRAGGPHRPVGRGAMGGGRVLIEDIRLAVGSVVRDSRGAPRGRQSLRAGVCRLGMVSAGGGFAMRRDSLQHLLHRDVNHRQRQIRLDVRHVRVMQHHYAQRLAGLDGHRPVVVHQELCGALHCARPRQPRLAGLVFVAA